MVDTKWVQYWENASIRSKGHCFNTGKTLMSEKIDRIIDANINRITEGLRVAEDIFRYNIVCSEIQQRLKDMRHRIIAAVDRAGVISSRASLDDVGFSSSGTNEYERSELRDIAAANFKRAEEGFRVLEEMYKIGKKDISSVMKKLRYELYDLEKKAYAKLNKKDMGKGLYLVMAYPPSGYEDIAKMAVRASLPAIQIRHKKGSDRELMSTAFKIREITSGSRTLFFVNDRLDIARLCEADGVHLGQNDIEPERARDFLGEGFLIGLSTLNLSQVEAAQNEPLDYIGFGPVWKTDSIKIPAPVTGVETLREAVKKSRHPVVAIGGINRHNVRELSGTGLNNIAVIRAVQEAMDPYAEMSFLNTFGEIL
jgi:thiamine-phosphate pyrophosphorylase